MRSQTVAVRRQPWSCLARHNGEAYARRRSSGRRTPQAACSVKMVRDIRSAGVEREPTQSVAFETPEQGNRGSPALNGSLGCRWSVRRGRREAPAGSDNGSALDAPPRVVKARLNFTAPPDFPRSFRCADCRLRAEACAGSSRSPPADGRSGAASLHSRCAVTRRRGTPARGRVASRPTSRRPSRHSTQPETELSTSPDTAFGWPALAVLVGFRTSVHISDRTSPR